MSSEEDDLTKSVLAILPSFALLSPWLVLETPRTYLTKPRVSWIGLFTRLTQPTMSGNAANNVDLSRKQILLNAFDMSTVGHLSPGQWKVGKTGIPVIAAKLFFLFL